MGQRAWTLADRIVDLLQVDAQWWTAPALASRFDAHPDSIWRVLRKLEKDGQVVRRTVEMAGTGDRVDTRIEWEST